MKHGSTDPLYALQVRLLYENAPLAFMVTLLNGALLGYIQSEFIPRATVLAWYGSLLLVTGLRAWVVRRYNRISPGSGEARSWCIAYAVGAGAAGSVWGASAVVLFPLDSIAHQVFVAFVLAGMAAGGISVLAPRLEACLAFLLPALLPLAIQYLTLDTPLHAVMGVMTLIYLGILLFTGRNIHRVIRTSLHLRFDKEDLEAEIARRQTAEERLLHEKDRLHATVSSIGESVVLIDRDGCIEYLNPAAERLFDQRCQDALHRSPAEVFECFDDQGGRVTTALEDCVRSAQPQKKQSVLYDGDTTKRVVEELATPLLDRLGKLVGAVSVFRDVTAEQQLTERLLHAANHDMLTGLPNRNLLKDRIHHSIARAHRKRESFALLFVDLDEFKAVNDTLGHASGDALLVGVARRLSECVREEDTVARLGGDEFVLLIDGPTQRRHIEAIADKIGDALREPFQLGGTSATIAGSIGISLYPGDGADLASLLAHADASMYRAKRTGPERKA